MTLKTSSPSTPNNGFLSNFRQMPCESKYSRETVRARTPLANTRTFAAPSVVERQHGAAVAGGSDKKVARTIAFRQHSDAHGGEGTSVGWYRTLPGKLYKLSSGELGRIFGLYRIHRNGEKISRRRSSKD